jgi:hypothetical protein
MPITSTIDHARREIQAVASGRVDFAEIQKHLFEQRDSKSLAYPEYVDGRTAEAAFSPADVYRIVDLLRKLKEQSAIGRKAVVAPAGQAFGLVRMIEMLAENFCEVKAFLAEEEAREWLASSE